MATRQTSTVVTTVGRAVGEHRRELVWLGAIALGLLAGVSLVGRHPDDPTWTRPDVTGVREVLNPGGWLGANVADLLYRLLGVGAWVAVLVLLGVAVLRLADRTVGAWWRWLGGVGAGWLTLAGLARIVDPTDADPVHPAGWMGTSLASVLEGVLGSVGSWIVLGVAWVACLGVVFRVSWGEVTDRVVERVEAEVPRVRDAAKAAGGTAGAWAKAGLAGLWSVLVAFLVGLGRLVLRGLQRAWIWTRRTAGEMWHAITHRDDHTDDPAWLRTAARDRRSTSGMGGSALEDMTDVRGGTVVRPDTDVAPPTSPDVEVTWDPTRAPPEGGAVHELLDMFPEFGHRHGATDAGPSTRASTSPPPERHAEIDDTLDDEEEEEDEDEVPVAPVPPATREAPAMARASAPAPSKPAPAPAPAPPPAVPLPVAASLVSDAPHGRPVVEAAEGLRDTPSQDDGGAVAARPSLYFELPPLNLLDPVPEQHAEFDEDELAELAAAVEESLASFKVTGRVTNVRVGPVVTTFEFLPDAGISVRKVANLTDDLAMALSARSVRVLAPIPGKGVVGIEVPNDTRMTIYLREMLGSPAFRKAKGALPVVIGKDVEGRPVVTDMAKMPHLLIGGTTGSGKSVGVNVLLMSMLFTKTPDELRLLLIDPKQLEFSAYADIPYLLHPVVKKADDAAVVLDWACREMDRRYKLLSEWNARNITNFNKKLEKELRDWNREKAWRFAPEGWEGEDPPPPPEAMPYIVIVIDELADLMMVAKKDVETSVVRLAQLARACGMHLIVATQRPSVDVVTGLIKSNMPTRIAFQLRSVTDSRTVLDAGGAEKLLGRGDMLMLPNDGGELRRIHGPFVEDDEVLRVVEFLKKQRKPQYIASIARAADAGGFEGIEDDGELDELYEDAVALVTDKGKASTSMIQRHLKIGYNRAARIIDQMESAGVVGPADGARPREVLVGFDGA